MTVGIAAFLTFRQSNYSTVVARYQSYWPGRTVDGHSFYPFNVDTIVSNTSGGQDSIAVSLAISNDVVRLVETGLSANYLIQLDFYSFVPTSNGLPPGSKSFITSFVGELISAIQNESSMNMQVGSSLSGVDAQSPPRKFTTTLVGQPPKL